MGGMRMNILMVEDEEVDRIAFTRFIAANNLSYVVTEAHSLKQGVALLGERAFDVVISDYQLGDGLVFDLVPHLRDTPFIVVTGFHSTVIAVGAVKAGASDFLIKDMGRKYLVQLPASIEGAIRKRRKEKILLDSARQKDELLRQLDVINRELREFTDEVSHDLKAPLRGMNSLVKWIKSDCADRLDGECGEKLSLLQDCIRRMHDLIQGFLESSNRGWGGESRAVVEVNALVRDIGRLLFADPERIRVSGPVFEVTGNLFSLRQILQNLISNAFSHGGAEDSPIEVACMEEKGFWRFTVSDHGPGVPSHVLERLLHPETVPAESSRSERGSGIGLTIVQKLVSAQGGRMWADSKPGLGSAFHFTLPAQPTLPFANQAD